MINKKVILGSTLLIVLLLGSCSQLKKLPIVTGYAAKKVCTYTFVSNLPQETIESEDLGLPILQIATNRIDKEEQSVTSKALGLLGTKTAVYREGLGCVLLHGEDDFQVAYPGLSEKSEETEGLTTSTAVTPLPKHTEISAPLAAAVEALFDPNGGMDYLNTRAVVVVHKDTIVAEKYADGIDKHTELLGWSMTKSIMNAWVGMLIMDGQIAVTDTELMPEWIDERKDLSLEHLLHMDSGLDWSEDYTTISGATTMLFDAEDAVRTAASYPLAHTPGSKWLYSSGTTNIISGYLRRQYEQYEDYQRYPHERIFGPLGMESAVLEIDETGNYIGSSYCYATARDWARFGLLYLHDGVWDGQRLLPEGWVDYTTQVVPDSKGLYGAHFWLNVEGADMPDVPHDTFMCKGYQGQLVIIIPSEDMVIVRLGLNENLDFNTFVADIIASVQ